MDDSIDAAKPGSGGGAKRNTSAGKSQQKPKGKGKQEDLDHDREARSYFGCRFRPEDKNKNCSICKLQVDRPDLFTAQRKTVDFKKGNIKSISFT